jgi:hypothetical protein
MWCDPRNSRPKKKYKTKKEKEKDATMEELMIVL